MPEFQLILDRCTYCAFGDDGSMDARAAGELSIDLAVDDADKTVSYITDLPRCQDELAWIRQSLRSVAARALRWQEGKR